MYLCQQVLLLLLVYPVVDTLTITSFVATGDAILGPSNVQLTCSYIPAIGDTVVAITLQAKLSGTFKNIAAFSTPRIGNDPNLASPDGSYLENRVTLTNPTSDAADVQTQTVMTFNETVCEDETEYKCTVTLIGSSGVHSPEITTNIEVKGKPAMPDNIPRWVPESGIEEGTDVTFTCTGNVGKPAGKFKWTKLRGSTPTEYPGATTTAVEMPGTCTFNGTSTLTIRLTAEDNNAVVRCTVDQELATTDTYRENQPDSLVVFYQVRNIQITKSPNLPNFAEGASDITLTCSAQGNPAPTYTWHKDTDVNTTLATGNVFTIQTRDVIVNNTGNYVCVAHNTFNGKDHDLQASEYIQIDFTTTPAPTTTRSTTTTTVKTSVPAKDTRNKDDGGTTENFGLLGGIIFLCLLQIIELIVLFILHRKGIVVFRLQNEKVYEDSTKNRADQHVYSEMNRSDHHEYSEMNRPNNHVYSEMNTSAGVSNAQNDERYYNL